MMHWLINKHILLRRMGWGVRWWMVNFQRHRDDGGPTYEHINGYCEWCEHGVFIRNNE